SSSERLPKEMFYSTDLLLRKDARFSLIWRLAISKGHAGGTRKRQILAVNISSIVAELQQRIPAQPLTADQQLNCFSLRLISQLLYGTCIVLQYQIANLHVDAKHVWDSCRHIRFDEKERSTKKKKRDDKRDDFDWDQFPPDEPLAKKRKRRSMLEGDGQELHESQIILGMDFLDRALATSRSAFDMTNITLPDDTMFGVGGMADPMFVQPEQDLIPTTDAMMDAFLNGEDTTFTTKEASQNRSGERVKDISPFELDRPAKMPREERAASEIEGHRASSHFSYISGDRTGAMQPFPDDVLMMDDLNLSSSMAGIDGNTRTSIPAHFVSSGPFAVSSQVDPALEPILPSEASQIVPVENGDATIDVAILPENTFYGEAMDEMRVPSVRGDEDEQQRASAGSEEKRRDIMDDLMMADEMDARARQKREERVLITDDGTPIVKRRREAKEEREETEEREYEPHRELKPIKLDGAFMKESMANYSDTMVGRNARRVKIDERKKKRAEDLIKTIPSMRGRVIHKNRILNDLYKRLKVDKMMLKEDDDSVDDLIEDEEEELELMPWKEIVRENERVEEEDEEEEEDEREKAINEQRAPEEVMADQSWQQQNRMDDMVMMDNTTMDGLENVEHLSVATIEGDWEDRNEYVDQITENRYEEKELNEEERRKLGEERVEEDDGEMEEARRRRTTGNFSDGIRMNDEFDLMDPSYQQQLDESRRSEARENEGEEMMDRVEWRGETEARVNRDKRSTMAQVEHHQAKEIILTKCDECETKKVTLEECIPIGANKATVARMFYNLLVLAKEQSVVPEQEEAYGPIHIGLVSHHQFPTYEVA
ncbi:hypothetical protein PFISCL1PPCAC_19486, partial [Pristionchus fissidentatus]